jgi:hypothetical protein
MLRRLDALVTALSMRVGIVSSPAPDPAPRPIVHRRDRAYLES